MHEPSSCRGAAEEPSRAGRIARQGNLRQNRVCFHPPGLLSEAQRAEWDGANNPTRLMRRMRAAMRSAPWMLRLAARLSETQAGGRLLYDRVLKPAAGVLEGARPAQGELP